MNKKDEGFCQYVLAIIVVLVLVLLILYSFSMRKIALQKQEIEDGITASALASAIIDKNGNGEYYDHRLYTQTSATYMSVCIS